ncbi:acyltransferase family protein [Nocardiopsis tropica]|uniref:Acyltransferase family protein n=1 Tax=Nocardiopsis tropica TaxID=109330 RepID=A0ABU7L1H6_9ACTN|nr:acyltransferase family protein [Nocardiopsis umidischolae]MEE2055412.1 acyltransferase family protein [Nocardiopsis umidischolae]
MSVSAAGAPAPATTNTLSREPSGTRKGGGFRPEIEGLRAVAVLLVAFYHVWFGRVSGGVDVFLLLTGFLITGSLVRALERDGRIGLAAFWTKLARRLTPAAAVVLAATLAATWLWLPRSRWTDVIAQVRAAALYHENWALARAAVDYLARESAASPVQHFWSLSIQGQFYLLWPLLLGLTALVAARLRVRSDLAFPAVVGLVFAASLAYSVWITGTNQAWAYFDTGARLWEPALGGLLALVVHRIDLPVRLRVVLGWAGLLALVSCGVLLQVSTLFPGYVALWPTGAAVMVVLAGSGTRFGADRLLTWKPLMALGALSYPFYLWHWPVLVCYLAVTDRSLASPLGGVFVLALSLLLALVTSKAVEGGVERLTRAPARRSPAWSLGVAAALLAPVLAATALWSGRIEEEQQARAEEVRTPAYYPGARLAVDPSLLLQEMPVRPDPADASQDLSPHHARGCHVPLTQSEVTVCDAGPADAEHTLALVGASRVAHWYPSVLEAAEDNGWRLLSFTKSGCQFGTGPHTRGGEPFPECEAWNAEAMEILERERPDAVFTSSTRASPAGERVHEGFVERWRQLDALGIDVIGMRDLPRRDTAGAECVESRPLEECVSPAGYSQAAADPAAAADLPGNVTTVDLTEYVCPDGRCDAVIGNVLVFWDHSHMTATYSATLAPVMDEALRGATGW